MNGTGTNFKSGTTAVDFGSGVKVLSVTAQSPTALTAEVVVAADAPPGVHTVTATTGSEVATALSNGLTVVQPCTASQDVAVQSFTPDSGLQGTNAGAVVVQVGPGLGNLPIQAFAEGVTTADFGPGITVNSLRVDSNSSLTATISISPTAPLGQHYVTFRTANVVIKGTFNVVSAPAVLSAAFDKLACNQVVQIELKGTNTSFNSGETTVDFGPGITVLGLSIQSPTNLNAQLYIPEKVSLKARTVTATTGPEVAKLQNFLVTQPCAAPGNLNLESLFPNAKEAGTGDLVIHATGTTGLGGIPVPALVQGVTTADFGPGITVKSLQVNSATRATVDVSIDPTAAVGPRDVKFTTANIVSTGTFTVQGLQTVTSQSTLTTAASAASRAPTQSVVTPPPPPRQPLSVSAATSPCNAAGSFDVASESPEFLAGATSVDFGSDITVLGVTVQNAGKLTAQLSIPSGATQGAHTVTVKIGAKTITASGVFTVTSPCAKSQYTQLIFTPLSGVQNEQNITVHVRGESVAPAGFVQGVTTADFGDGITVNSVNVISSNAVDVNISISSTAYAGNHNVSLKTDNSSGSGTFKVQHAGNTTLTVSATTTPCNVVGSFLLTGPGAHFLSGTSQVDFGPDITVLTTTVQTSAELLAQIYVPASANPGAHTVTVTTGGETASSASGLAVTTPCATTQESMPYIAPTPSQGVLGEQNLTVSLPGANLTRGVTVADFGQGITVNSVTVTSASHANVNISIDNSAFALGTHRVTLTTANNVTTNQFKVISGGNKTLSLTTATAQCNQVALFPIYSSTASFAKDITTVDFGPDITVLSVKVQNQNNLTAQLYIPAGATIGAHTVTATTATEVASLPSGFTVTSPCAAKQSVGGRATPAFGVVGVQNMTVHVSGSGLAQGVTTADFGDGITVNSISVTANGADINISISPTTYAGNRNVTITTANQVISLRNSNGTPFQFIVQK